MAISETIRKSYLRLLPVQIFSALTAAINSMIDSMVTGTYLGTDAMAAIGLFGPMITVIYFCSVLYFGMRIVIGVYIGSGNERGVNTVFNTGMLFSVLYGLILAGICFVLVYPLSALMGARGDLSALFANYVRGYAPGIPFLALSFGLTMMISYNNDIRRSYVALFVMIASNIGLDYFMTLYLKAGTAGIGAATTISYICSVLILLPSFLKKSNTLHFVLQKPDLKELKEIARLGADQLSFNLGNTIKAYMINIAVMHIIGPAAVAVVNVQGTLSAALGAFPCGNSGAYSTLSGIYFGEEDRHSFLSLTKLSLITGFIITDVITLLMAAFSGVIPYAFFPNDPVAFAYARRMLIIFPCVFIFNSIINVFWRSHLLQKRLTFVNTLIFLEQILQGILALGMACLIGLDGVFAAYPLSNIIVIGLLYLYGMKKAAKKSTGVSKWTALPDNFGAPEDCVRDYTVNSMEDVINISESVIDFCTDKGIPVRTANVAGLCIEEMAGNVVTYGFDDGHKHILEIRVVVYNGLVIRLRDDCRAFDPKERMKQYTPEDPCKNIGIRMISNLTQDMSYHNDAGINTLLIRL